MNSARTGGWIGWALAGFAALGCGGTPGAVAVDTAGLDESSPPDGGAVFDVTPLAVGDQLWLRTFDQGGGYADYGHAVAVGGDGSIVVVGETHTFEPTIGFDIWVRKYDRDGNPLWTRTHDGATSDGATDDSANAVAIDSQGAVLVAGAVSGDRTLWLRKYDADGTVLWTAGGDRGSASGVAVNRDGEVLVVGRNIGLRRYSSDGAELMRQDLGDLDPWGLALAPDGAVVVVGSSPGSPGSDGVVRKLSANGAEVWTRSFASDMGASGLAVAVAGDGQVVAGGAATSATGNDSLIPNFWLRKYDADGTELWTRGDEVGSVSGLAIDSSGAIAVASLGGRPFSLRKYDPAGNLFWTVGNAPGLIGFRAVQSVALDRDGALVSAGTINVENMVFAAPVDIFVAKYAP